MNLKQDFLENGLVDLGEVLDKQKCEELLQKVFASRDFGTSLFIDEEQHRKNPRFNKTNPGPGINLTEKMNLSFIEENPTFKNSMKKVLGSDYKIMLKKFIVGIQDDWIPKWVTKEINELGASGLGPFIKPEFHDISYFHGVDFHQDLIDHPNRNADFITLYVYLDDVEQGMSPLFIIPKSHIFGATIFPHKITQEKNSNKLTYEDGKGNSDVFDFKMLTGGFGHIYFWSALILHGTQPAKVAKPRISLRYLIERGKSQESCLIDELNKNINGPLLLEKIRTDRKESGQLENLGNIINKVDSNL